MEPLSQSSFDTFRLNSSPLITVDILSTTSPQERNQVSKKAHITTIELLTRPAKEQMQVKIASSPSAHPTTFNPSTQIRYEMHKQQEEKPGFWARRFALQERVEQFLNENKTNPVARLLLEYCCRNLHYRMTKIVELPEIACPNRAALEWSAQKYAEKYKIVIHVLCVSELAQKIRTINERAKHENASVCVGFIVAKDENIDEGHVAPMIVFFSPTQTPQCILMDVLPGFMITSLKNVIPQALPSDLCKMGSLVCAPAYRQADTFSCRTGALTLLRNALLSLLDSEDPPSYWKEVFQKAANELPPEWTYVEQLQLVDKRSLTQAIAIRDKFSKHSIKRQNPRTVQERISAKSEDVTLEYSIYCPFEGKLTKNSLHNLSPPAGSSIELRPYGVIFKMRSRKNIYTYLVRKGLKNRKNTGIS